MSNKGIKPSRSREPNNAERGVSKNMGDNTEAFEITVARAEKLGELAKQAADESIKISQEGDSRTEEAGEAVEEKAEVLTSTFGEVINVAGDNAKRKKETREVQKRIEARLESLARMFASNKTGQAEEEDEEEEN